MALRWDLSLHDIVWTVFIDADYDGNVTWQEVQDARAAHRPAPCSAQIAVQRGGAPARCAFADFALAATRANRIILSVALRAACPRRRAAQQSAARCS